MQRLNTHSKWLGGSSMGCLHHIRGKRLWKTNCRRSRQNGEATGLPLSFQDSRIKGSEVISQHSCRGLKETIWTPESRRKNSIRASSAPSVELLPIPRSLSTDESGAWGSSQAANQRSGQRWTCQWWLQRPCFGGGNCSEWNTYFNTY